MALPLLINLAIDNFTGAMHFHTSFYIDDCDVEFHAD